MVVLPGLYGEHVVGQDEMLLSFAFIDDRAAYAEAQLETSLVHMRRQGLPVCPIPSGADVGDACEPVVLGVEDDPFVAEIGT